MPEALSLDASGGFFALPASFLVPELASGGLEAPATSPAMKRRDDAAFCISLLKRPLLPVMVITVLSYGYG